MGPHGRPYWRSYQRQRRLCPRVYGLGSHAGGRDSISAHFHPVLGHHHRLRLLLHRHVIRPNRGAAGRLVVGHTAVGCPVNLKSRDSWLLVHDVPKDVPNVKLSPRSQHLLKLLNGHRLRVRRRSGRCVRVRRRGRGARRRRRNCSVRMHRSEWVLEVVLVIHVVADPNELLFPVGARDQDHRHAYQVLLRDAGRVGRIRLQHELTDAHRYRAHAHLLQHLIGVEVLR
mmetsp:Transcript_96301/g.274376  ORF Transcript_96301/g.274376 Transcript_96301/m.274376 type:complete len:228 (-) Transcript_96301:177-860(-)